MLCEVFSMLLTRYLVITAFTATMGLAAAASAIEVAQSNTPSQANPATPRPVAPAPVDRSGRRNWPVWQRGDSLSQNDDWAESNFSVEEAGSRLLLSSQGSVEIQLAQVQFADGQVQPIPIRNQPYGNGLYLLLDFGSTQTIQSIRVVARANASRSAYSVQLWR
jgi:hypothetical protein